MRPENALYTASELVKSLVSLRAGDLFTWRMRREGIYRKLMCEPLAAAGQLELLLAATRLR